MNQRLRHTLATLTGNGKRLRYSNLVIGAVLLAFILTSVVQASTTPTTYYACVLNKIGTIRMISSSQSCTQYETEISWNNVGPQGSAGPQGLQGPLGHKGLRDKRDLRDQVAYPPAIPW